MQSALPQPAPQTGGRTGAPALWPADEGRDTLCGMFDTLTDKLTAVFTRLGNKGRLTEDDVGEALREVRLALLEADVNFRVAREFVAAHPREDGRRRGAPRHLSRPAGGQARPRPDGRAPGRGRARNQIASVAAVRDHACRPARLGQDDDGRQARAAPAPAGPAGAAHRGRPAPSRRDGPAGIARQAAGRARLSGEGGAGRRAKGRGQWAEARPRARGDVGHRGHGGPSPYRRRAHGRAR